MASPIVASSIAPVPPVAGVSRVVALSPVMSTVQVLSLLSLILSPMNGGLNFLSLAFANEEAWNIDLGTCSVIRHYNVGCGFVLIVVDDNSHDATKLLNVLGLMNEGALSTVNHDNRSVLVQRSLFQVKVIEVRLLKLPTAVGVG